ncbi:branched-chain amino acid ABC transporter permease [Bradyrhizobium sp. HKCCYLRH1073]|uniref:branched-chain amino acid ABC transporter permease n=1 Tax=unclassified Bradyrhizobium TaxID=2631580 RepID=UPI002916EE48|nr:MULTISPECIES: branched-chain amino acid ABC transporter permease [unclassified Bradyrhizobium]
MSDSNVILRRQTTSSVIALAVSVLILVAIPTMPYWASNGHIRWAIELSCLVAIAQMWNLLAGYAGLVSVGQQAFIGVGGYTLFVLSNNMGFNPFLTVPLSAFAAAVVSVPAYVLLRRLDGPYFAIGTWVFAEALRLLTANISYVNGGSGMSLRVMAQYTADQRALGLTIMSSLLLLFTVGGSYALLRSRFGLAVVAIRDEPVAAASQGVNVKRIRLTIWMLAAAGTGMAGALYYTAQLRITPDAGFDPYWSSICIFSVMVGGVGRLEGPIIGALLYFFATRFFGQYGATYLVALGLLTLLMALFSPGGLWSQLSKLGNWPWFPVTRTVVNPLRRADEVISAGRADRLVSRHSSGG